jgi:hypothetical protein
MRIRRQEDGYFTHLRWKNINVYAGELRLSKNEYGEGRT